MDKSGNYPPAGGQAQGNSISALKRFDRPLAPHEVRVAQRQIVAAAIGLICVLGVIGWALTL